MSESEPPERKALRIAVVGPCAAGKSTLIEALRTAGYENVYQPAQEHSYVPDMWQRITKPDLLIYLDVDYAQARVRRPHLENGGAKWLEMQRQRLAHARAHCHFYVDTSDLIPSEVEGCVLRFLETRRLEIADSKIGD